MDTQYNSKKIFCDSDNPHATGTSHMRKQFTLGNPIIIPPQSKVKMLIGVEAVSIPLSFYVFNESNNKIRYRDSLNATHTYTLGVGNFTISRLLAIINADDDTFPFNISYDREFSKLSLIPDEGEEDFEIYEVANSCYNLLGIVANTYTTGTAFPYTINLIYTTGVSIAINNIENLNDEANPNSSSKKIIRIPITSSINTYLTFFNNEPFYSTINNKVLNFLDVSILDDNGNVLETNGNHYFHITFRIDFTKPPEEVLEKTLIQKFRKSHLENTLVPQDDDSQKEDNNKN